MKRIVHKTWLQNFRALFAKEMKEVLRDRRAAFFTFLFPLLLYPLLYAGWQKFKASSHPGIENRDVRIGIDGDGDDFLKTIEKSDAVDVGLGVPMDDELLDREEFDALLRIQKPEGSDGKWTLQLRFDGSRSMSREAARRAGELANRFRLRLAAGRLRERGVAVDLEQPLTIRSADVAGSRSRGEAWLGRLMPAIFILLFFTGGAFAAMDLLAGEKERGTLETLLVQPVSEGCVAASKFAVILLCSLGAAVMNLLGMVLAQEVHLQAGASAFPEIALPSFGRLGLALLFLLPLAFLVSAVLMAISVCSRSFREGQTLLIPAMVLGLLPAALAAFPNFELNPATACIPVGNVALAIREAMAGERHALPMLLAFGSTAAYAGLAMGWSVRLLKREDILLGLETQPLAGIGRPRTHARRALAFAALMLLALYYGATLLQAPDGWLGSHGGLALTLWGLVLVPALAYPRVCRLPFQAALGLRRPAFKDLVLAACLIPVVLLLITAYIQLQDRWLPFPEGLENAFRKSLSLKSLHPAAAFLLFALSPAVCEEVLWRGTFQGELERECRPWLVIFLSGLFFGLFHLSVYRLMPTALLGGFLAYLRWRTGSLFPSMLFHGAYNAAVLCLVAPLVESGDPVIEALLHPATLAAAAGLLFLLARRIGIIPPLQPNLPLLQPFLRKEMS
ncbi:MAG: CPBP family intramembrane metalloprotease [Planctomycetes bacterium]|nr:CPBP family intramembrane metalloprotease [Planctomycetota bacterium]